MSRVLRLNTLLDRNFQPGERSLKALWAALDTLDALCKTLGVTALSQFLDSTAVELQQAVKLIDDDAVPAADPVTDPETGLAYGIEDMSWQPIAAGMSSLEALEQHLQRDANQADLMQELKYCISALAPLEAEGAQFHLAVTPD